MKAKTGREFRGIIHYVGESLLLASRKNVIYVSRDGSDSWEAIFEIPISISFRIKESLSLPSRLFRTQIHHLSPVDKSTIVLIGYGHVYAVDLNSKKIIAGTPIQGKRPLALYSNGSQLYYGEYRGNKERTPVDILGSSNKGLNWGAVFQFKNVRHIHGVFHDPYEDKIWVTTGDTDKESHIWVTEDHFQTVKKVVGGNQQTRAMKLLFTRSHVYLGTDTQSEPNFIYRIDRKTRNVEKLQEVGNSISSACKVGDCLFFSTVVEISKVNKSRDVCIWGSKDGEIWKCVASFRKDIWQTDLFQYGQIIFPAGQNNSKYLWFTPFATEKHKTVRKLPIEEMF